jgi:hypothetical protein
MNFKALNQRQNQVRNHEVGSLAPFVPSHGYRNRFLPCLPARICQIPLSEGDPFLETLWMWLAGLLVLAVANFALGFARAFGLDPSSKEAAYTKGM